MLWITQQLLPQSDVGYRTPTTYLFIFCPSKWNYYSYFILRGDFKTQPPVDRGFRVVVRGLAFSSEGGGSQIYWGGHKFLERKIGGHKIFDDQNVGSHKMTTDGVFILFKKTDFNTILACLGGKVYRWWGGHKIFVAEIGRVAVFVNLGPPFRRKCQPPYCLEQ